LQAASLRDVDFHDPGQVLGALNQTYQMQRNSDLYFTLWYGVYQPTSRRLDFGCAGHPAAVLVEPGTERVELLRPRGPPIGLMPGASYARETMTVPRGRHLYLLSDGAFEVERADGTMLTFGEFVPFLARHAADGGGDLDRLYRRLLALRGSETLEDDFSIVRFAF
jgi:sigma-B regulation protein RsbU (phosphoserine phosphatase)